MQFDTLSAAGAAFACWKLSNTGEDFGCLREGANVYGGLRIQGKRVNYGGGWVFAHQL